MSPDCCLLVGRCGGGAGGGVVVSGGSALDGAEQESGDAWNVLRAVDFFQVVLSDRCRGSGFVADIDVRFDVELVDVVRALLRQMVSVGLWDVGVEVVGLVLSSRCACVAVLKVFLDNSLGSSESGGVFEVVCGSVRFYVRTVRLTLVSPYSSSSCLGVSVAVQEKLWFLASVFDRQSAVLVCHKYGSVTCADVERKVEVGAVAFDASSSWFEVSVYEVVACRYPDTEIQWVYPTVCGVLLSRPDAVSRLELFRVRAIIGS